MSEKIYLRIYNNKMLKDMKNYQFVISDGLLFIIDSNKCYFYCGDMIDFNIGDDIKIIEELELFERLSRKYIGSVPIIKLKECLYNDIIYYPIFMTEGLLSNCFVLIKSENQDPKLINELKRSIRNYY